LAEIDLINISDASACCVINSGARNAAASRSISKFLFFQKTLLQSRSKIHAALVWPELLLDVVQNPKPSGFCRLPLYAAAE
jgi:hypothetical protein